MEEKIIMIKGIEIKIELNEEETKLTISKKEGTEEEYENLVEHIILSIKAFEEGNTFYTLF